MERLVKSVTACYDNTIVVNNCDNVAEVGDIRHNGLVTTLRQAKICPESSVTKLEGQGFGGRFMSLDLTFLSFFTLSLIDSVPSKGVLL